jgi:hypothetical protein
MIDATVLRCVITCPACGARTEAEMPTDACQFFWACPACGTVLRPREGDCCVFCSYGDVPCPPLQRSHSRSEDDSPSPCCS